MKKTFSKNKIINGLLYCLYNITGGRPMRYRQYLFTDCVDGKPVNLYIDKFERYWMANNKWSVFRVKYYLDKGE